MQNQHKTDAPSVATAKVLLVGLGGLGCPTALLLTQAGVGYLTILDDDVVERSNLHRQILFDETHVGKSKLSAGLDALRQRCPTSPTELRALETRLLPDNARQLVRDADLVIEGSDNFATKFLCADACFLEQKPCVQGAAVRWLATAMSTAPGGGPCYRCLFEDVPRGEAAPNCAEAGVVGSVVGMGASLMAELALRILHERADFGAIYTYDGKRDALHRHPLYPRLGCPLCGTTRAITELDWALYDPEVSCAALESHS
jgi:adenylyltransferase/sulfurtransferase